MNPDHSQAELGRALEDFRKARAKAQWQRFLASITGETQELLPYDEITRKLHARGLSSKGLQEVPVKAIVGSVNRYQDFDRNFLPLRDGDMERWARVKAVMTSPGSAGLPPIRVYKLGDVYFVLDGNHRVSIARMMDIETVEAYVTEIRSKVTLSPDDSPEELILKEEYADFLDETKFDQIVPDVELKLTFPGQYNSLIEHIHVHRYYMGIEEEREVPWEEAVRHWYEFVYLPVVKIIRDQGILDVIPDRTETDLYLWVMDHKTYMQEEFGWSIRPDKAVSDLIESKDPRFFRKLRKIGKKLIRIIIPKAFENYPTPGKWRENVDLDERNLFADILVAMSGTEESWLALEQAIFLAELEQAEVRGLAVRGKGQKESAYAHEDLAEAFQGRIEQSGLSGNLAYAEGRISDTIIERAKVNDLVVLHLSHPPESGLFKRLESGIRLMIRQCSRPILFVRDEISPMNHMLLSYDGSPKSKEALFITAYFTDRYKKKVTVLVVNDDRDQAEALMEEAGEVLGECVVENIYRPHSGRVGDIILQVAYEVSAETIMMGGYGLSPLLEMVFGSTVDGVLRRSGIPVLVCQ